MVIKGSAAKRDGERLHPAADVEQEGKKEKGGTERKGWDGVCGGEDVEKKKRKRKTGEKGQEGRREDRERDKQGLNSDRK